MGYFSSSRILRVQQTVLMRTECFSVVAVGTQFSLTEQPQGGKSLACLPPIVRPTSSCLMGKKNNASFFQKIFSCVSIHQYNLRMYLISRAGWQTRLA